MAGSLGTHDNVAFCPTNLREPVRPKTKHDSTVEPCEVDGLPVEIAPDGPYYVSSSGKNRNLSAVAEPNAVILATVFKAR